MKEYLRIVRRVLAEGKPKMDRTGVGTIAIFGEKFEHDMSQGFPLLTTKEMAKRSMAVELEGFLSAKTDKLWYQERGCRIWNQWCSPTIVTPGNDAATRARMFAERDLGPIYGFQWRHFGAEYLGYDADYSGKGKDQIQYVIDTFAKDPNSRKMVVSAWNPVQLEQMALEPCHRSFQVDMLDGKLNLSWDQRSVDVALGLPFNIASYGLLLHLFAKQFGVKEGKLVGNLGDTHAYLNHIDGLKGQLNRGPRKLPRVLVNNFKSVLDWKHTDTEFEGYHSHPKIKFEVAV